MVTVEKQEYLYKISNDFGETKISLGDTMVTLESEIGVTTRYHWHCGNTLRY